MLTFFLGVVPGIMVGLTLAYFLSERKRKRDLEALKAPGDSKRSGRTRHALK